MVAVLAAVGLAFGAGAQAHGLAHKCARNGGARVCVRRKPPQAHAAMTPLAWCVSGLESGHDFSINTGNGFYGGFQFVTSTWLAVQRMMGVYWAPRADLATEAEQVAAFDYYSAIDPGAWPNTIPRCE